MQLAIRNSFHTRCVLVRCADGGRQDARQFTGFLEKRGLVDDRAVSEVFESVDALVGFLEGDVKLGLELRS